MATESNEDYWLSIAHAGATSHVEKLVRRYRTMGQREANVASIHAHDALLAAR